VKDARTHVAWLLWCLDQGYIKAEDRAILDNWLEEDPATLHPDDAEQRPHLRTMADEVIAAVKGMEES
jgi:hypothetical protein